MAGPVDWPVSTQSISNWVTRFGSSHRLGRCCLWLAALPFRWIGSADVPLCRHLLLAVSQSASHEMETPLFVPLCRNPVGQMVEV